MLEGEFMLIDIDSGRTITHVPHLETFDPLQTRLGQDFSTIVEYIDELIDEAGGEIVTAGWLPKGPAPGEWPRPLMPIYDIAAKRNYDLAGRMFGLMVWYTVMQRPERWGSLRCEDEWYSNREQDLFSS